VGGRTAGRGVEGGGRMGSGSVTGCESCELAVRETVNSRLLPSVIEVSAIEMVAVSLSTMVPVAAEVPITGVACAAPLGFVSVTVTVSLLSAIESVRERVVKVWGRSPAAQVTVPVSGRAPVMSGGDRVAAATV